MSFGCNLYSFAKRQNSTAIPTLDTTESEHFEIDVKEPFSIMNPQLVFEFEPGYNPTNYNYAYIAQWERRYRITDWTNERGLWVATCDVDVLGTWRRQIGATPLYVLRAENDFNGEIVDTYYPATQDEVIQVATGNDLFTHDMTTGTYVVGIINDDSLGGTGAVTYYAFNQYNFQRAMHSLLDGVSWMNIASIENNLQKAIFNPLQYIASVQYFPMSYTGGVWVDSINLGWWDSVLTSASAGTELARRIDTRDPVVSMTLEFALSHHPQISRGSYLDYSPYCNMWLDLQPFGLIPLDVSQVRANNNGIIRCAIDVDMLSGVGSLRITNTVPSGIAIIDHVQAKVSFDVPIAQISVGSDGLGSAVGGFGSAAAGSKVGAVLGIASAVAGLMVPKCGQVGSYTGAQSMLKGAPQLLTQYYTIVDEDNAHNGRPLCEVRTPASLGGYMIVEKGDVSAPATGPELERIKEYLEGGFYYE